MEYSTKAIVLHAIKHRETSIILQAYTEQAGLKSYIVKGPRTSNKKKIFSMAMFQPLTQLEIVANSRNQTNLSILKTAKIINPYTTIATNFSKSGICIFLSEVLRSVLKEEEQNQPLYSFLEHSLVWLDIHKYVANAHIYILLQLTKHLGFYPNTSTIQMPYFDMQNGCFCKSATNSECKSGEEITLLKDYLGMKFDEVQMISVNAKQRRALLTTLMRYYQLHIQAFRMPKSLEILYEVFND